MAGAIVHRDRAGSSLRYFVRFGSEVSCVVTSNILIVKVLFTYNVVCVCGNL